MRQRNIVLTLPNLNNLLAHKPLQESISGIREKMNQVKEKNHEIQLLVSASRSLTLREL